MDDEKKNNIKEASLSQPHCAFPFRDEILTRDKPWRLINMLNVHTLKMSTTAKRFYQSFQKCGVGGKN